VEKFHLGALGFSNISIPMVGQTGVVEEYSPRVGGSGETQDLSRCSRRGGSEQSYGLYGAVPAPGRVVCPALLVLGEAALL